MDVFSTEKTVAKISQQNLALGPPLKLALFRKNIFLALPFYGPRQKLLSGFFPLRGGGYLPFC